MKKFLLLILLFTSTSIFSEGIVINEIMSSNNKTIYDEFGEASDWIEFYNDDTIAIDLNGYFLSDDSANIKKWQFGESTLIDPGDYLIVFASDKDTLINYHHTNFKISASGEEILLSDSSSNIVDSIYIPSSLPDVAYGRISDGSLPWIFQSPTPGSKNIGNEIKDYSDSVSVSIPGGFYPSSISLELSAGSSEIYYTLDGSDPDSNKTKYTAPINIDKTTVVKAVSLSANHLPSPINYQTYFINENTDLPVISLIADPYNLFDPDSGIYTNYTMDWERPAHVEFFDDNKTLGFSENCGVEIYGGQSATAPQKSLAVKFKNDYGVSGINYPLFPDFRVTKFKAFVLRNSGNDFQYTHIRDAVMQALVKNLDIDYQEYRPATSFINGEYWGIYNIREKINEHYIANRHAVDPDNLDLLENNMEVIQGDSLSYKKLIDYITTKDMTTSSAYAYLDSTIDLNECILYFAAQAYYDNLDWPGTNIKFWRERSDSGKWRWILFGLDFGFGLYAHGPEEDHISFMFSPVETRYSNPPWATLLQRKLIENPTFKNRFINQIADLLNTKFKSNNVVNVINLLADHISSEITKHRNRWGIVGENLNKMITFAQQRPAYLRTHVRNYFNCGSDGNITLNSTGGGRVNLNTLMLDSTDLPWSGVYFMNNPVVLKAIPDKGYKFDGWSGSVISYDDSIVVSVSRSTSLKANFSIDSSSSNEIVINEINYNSIKDFDSGDWIELYNRSDSTINLGGWYYSDSDSSHKFYLPDTTKLNPKGYLVIVENDSLFSSHFPDVKNYIGETGFGLSGSGEFMKLTDNKGQIVDSLTYDDNAPWPLEADGKGASLELSDPYKDNSLGVNWKASIEHGTPGKKNSTITSVQRNKKSEIPSEYTLQQNYPNPFNPTTKIVYQLPKEGYVSLKVYNILGKEIASLVNEKKTTGTYQVIFDGSNLSSGIYFYRLQSENFVETRKLILLK